MMKVIIPQPNRTFQGVERVVDHPQDRIRTTKVVPGDRSIGAEPDQLLVRLERLIGVPLGGQVIGMDFQSIAVQRVAEEDPTEEGELKI